jgi:hypothetical protein
MTGELMKRQQAVILPVLLLLFCGHDIVTSLARSDTGRSAGDGGGSAAGEVVAEDRAALEARFRATMEKATLVGRWCSIRDGEMGLEQEDRYTILGATKVGGDLWLIHARIQYGQREFVAPLPVQVRWAGDTAVMVVDGLAMPGGTREYSARVLVYGDTYAGTWSGGDQAGLLKGVIRRDAD